ncbi:MAG TPA: anti-sigma factor [Jiangellaceae bacterium]
MRHVDQDRLADLAIGEPAPDKVTAHLESCAQCAAEFEALGKVVSAGRELNETDVLVEPPPHVWEGVARAAGVDPHDLDRAAAFEAGQREIGPKSSQASGPGFRWTLAAAIAGLLAGIGGVVGWEALNEPDGDQSGSIVAQAALDPVAESTASGRAELVDVDGERRLDIDVADLPAADGYLEVWLLAPDVSGMVSLGILPGSTATLAIPDGLDVSAFPVVDVSIEPFDGDPVHSGNSVIRGELQGDQ